MCALVQGPATQLDIRVGKGLPETSLETAILHTVAYADVFDYPLTGKEIHRYLMGVPASPDLTHAFLSNGRLVPQRLARQQEYFTLPGREAIVETRHYRANIAAQMWPRAIRYGWIIARLPFVRMVAVTGALAMNNVEQGADIDYLVVTEPGRLWLCRALVIVLVRLVACYGDVICPNYFLTEQALTLYEHNPFTAHELVQMIPIAGMNIYQRMRQLNAWTFHYLPNACGLPNPINDHSHQFSLYQTWGDPGQGWRAIRTVAEAMLRTSGGGWLEQWEMNRKVRKFNQQHERGNHHAESLIAGDNGQAEANFCADWCKGHFDNHGQRTLAAFNNLLCALEEQAR